MPADTIAIVALAISALVAAALVYLYRRGILSEPAISAFGSLIDGIDFDNSFLVTLAYYCSLAVKAVDQLVKSGQIPKDDEARKTKAIDYVQNYAAVDGYELNSAEMQAVETLIEAKVYEQRMEEQHPPEVDYK